MCRWMRRYEKWDSTQNRTDSLSLSLLFQSCGVVSTSNRVSDSKFPGCSTRQRPPTSNHCRCLRFRGQARAIDIGQLIHDQEGCSIGNPPLVPSFFGAYLVRNPGGPRLTFLTHASCKGLFFPRFGDGCGQFLVRNQLNNDINHHILSIA